MGFNDKLQEQMVTTPYPEPVVEAEVAANNNTKSASTQSTKIGLFKAIFLVTRSLIGVGVLAQPNMNYQFGWLAMLICYPIVAAVLIYLLSIFPRVASKIGYTGSNLEEFIEIVVGRKTSIITTVLILFFNISVSVCGVIFSVKFVNYSLCELGSSQCGNMWLINGLG